MHSIYANKYIDTNILLFYVGKPDNLINCE